MSDRLQRIHEANPGKCRSFAQALKPVFSPKQNNRSKTRPDSSIRPTKKVREDHNHPRHRLPKDPARPAQATH